MRKNKSKLMAFSLLALCLACLGFGVYALKNATLTVTGTVGFTAHDCLVNVMAEIEGDGVDANNVPNSHGEPSEKRDLIINKTENSNEMVVGGATADDWNKEAEIAETIWFTDLTEDGSVSEIVMTFTLTNQSAYSITASLSNAEIANVRVGASEEITLAAGAEGVLTATFNLDLNADGEYPEINSLPFEVKLDFKKAPAVQAPKNVSIENDILTFTPVEGATGYEVAFFTEGQDEPVYVYTTTESGLALQKPEAAGNYTVKVRSVLKEGDKTTYSDYVGTMEYINEGCSHLAFTECALDGSEGTEAYKVTGIGECTDETVIVPALYNGKPVVGIAENAFKEVVSFSSIVIPEGIKFIDGSAFYNCTSIKTIKIPTTLSSIGYNTFRNCIIENVYIYNITKWCQISFADTTSSPLYNKANLYLNNNLVVDVNLPKDLESVADYAFAGCKSLQSIVIPEGVTVLKGTFSNCESLINVQLPSTLEEIGNYTFLRCSLNELVIPEGVTKIGQMAFNYTKVNYLTLPKTLSFVDEMGFTNAEINNLYITDIESYCLITFKNNNFDNPTKNANLYLNGELVEELLIPASVETIPDYAFYNCLSIKSVTISEGVKSIGWGALSSSRINSIILPSTIESVGGDMINYNYTNIYYNGTENDYTTKVTVNGTDNVTNRVYYYSENQPTTTGQYWHYVTDEITGEQVPTVW